MKHVIILEHHTDPNKFSNIANFLREIYPVIRMGPAGEGNGYYAENWQVVWKTPVDNPPHMRGHGNRKWHIEFDDDEIYTLLAIKGLL